MNEWMKKASVWVKYVLINVQFCLVKHESVDTYDLQKDLFFCFIDYQKAFVNVRHEKLFKIVNQMDIDEKFTARLSGWL